MALLTKLKAMSKNFYKPGKLGLSTFILAIMLLMSIPGWATLSGSYTINGSASASSTNYQTFASAVSDLISGTRADGGTANGSGVSGPVVFSVASGTYTAQITITAITGASSTNTITFLGATSSGKYDSSLVVLSQASSATSTNNFTLYLKGASYVHFKYITISRTGTNSYGTAVQIGANSTTGSLNNLFYHCQMIGGAVTASSTNQVDLYISDQYDSLNVFRANLIKNGSYGVYILGTSGSPLVMGGNTLDSNIINGPYITGIYAQYESRLKITNGKIYNIAVASATSSTLYGIYTTGCDALKINNVTINTFNGTTSATQVGIYNVISTTGINDSLMNNSITGFPGYGAIGIQSSTNNTYIYNNTITGFTGSGSTMYGIYLSATSTAKPVISSNTIGNFTGTSGTQYGIYVAGTSSSPLISGNTIYNLYSTGTTQYGLYVYTPSAPQIINNSITNLNGVGTAVYGIYLYNPSTSAKLDSNTISFASSSVPAAGIYIYGPGTSTALYSRIAANKIFIPGGTQSGTLTSNNSYGGLVLFQLNGSSTVYNFVENNMITIGGSNVNFGIAGYYSQYTNFYYNSILLTNSNTSSAGFQSYYCCTSSIMPFKNNIVVNTGGGYAIAVPIWSSSNLGFTSDYNDYYVTGSNIGYYSSSSYATLSAWKTATGWDANTISANPFFKNTSTGDLHASSPSLKAGTSLTTVTVDYDNQSRGTTPMIGADEFTPASLDAGLMNYVNFNNYCSGTQSITATLANVGSTTLTSVTVSWTVNGTAQTPYSWTGSLAGGATSNITIGTYSFPSSGTVSVKAWVKSPNSGTDGNAANDTIWANNLQNGMLGTYTINSSGGNYASFSAAVTDLTTRGLCGGVLFKVADGTYTEQISIGSILNASSTQRVIFTSNSNDSTKVTLKYAATLSTAPYTVQLNNASYVTFKKMTIQATGTSYANVIYYAGTPSNDSIYSCILNGYSSTNTSNSFAVVYANFAATPITNLIFYNNIIKYGSYGIYYYGNNGTNTDQITVNNNQFTNQYAYGAYFYYAGALNFNNNLITSSSFTSSYYGLYTYWLYNTARAVQINSNRVYGSMTGYGMWLQYIDVNGSATVNSVTNNMIQMGSLSTSTTSVGLYTANCYYTNFYHNTAAVYGKSTSNYGATLASFSTSCVFKNNLIANMGNGALAYGAAIYNSASSTTYTGDYNAYYAAGGGTIGNNSVVSTGNLAAWKAIMGGVIDANSMIVNPAFTSTTDCHAANGALKFGVSGLCTTDYDGQTRASIPMVGADEFTASTTDASIAAINNTGYCSGSTPVIVTLANGGSSTLTSATIHWSVGGTAQTSYSWSGSLATGATANVTIGSYSFSSGSYAILAYPTSPNGGTDGVNADDTAKITITAAMSGAFTINSGGSGSTNYTTFGNAITALKNNGVCGAATFSVTTGYYPETIVIPTIIGASASNQITFVSAANDSSKVYLRSSSTTPTIELNGASYINFNKITIGKTTTSYANCVYIHGSAANNTFYHCRIGGVKNMTSNSSSYYTIYTATTDVNNNNTFRGNQIIGGYYGIYWYGASTAATGFSNNTVIDSNYIDSAYTAGIFAYYNTALQISNNKIRYIGYGTSSYTSTAGYGIYTYYICNGSKFYNNVILLPGSGTAGIANFYHNYSTSLPSYSNNYYYNNMVAITAGSNTTYGIEDYYTNYSNYYNNSVNITNTSTSSTALYVYNYTTTNTPNFVNNCWVNTGGGYAAYYSGAVSSYIGTLNYNNLYVSGTNLVYNAGTNYTSMSSYKTGVSTREANSVNVTPSYNSSTDLHATSSSLKAVGTSVAAVTTDIDGISRPSVPSIGANEVITSGLDASISAITSPSMPFAAGSVPIKVTIANYGSTTLTSATVSWTVGGTAQTPYSWTGSLTSGQTATITLSVGTTFTVGTSVTITAKTASPNGGTDLVTSNDQSSVTVCPGLSGGTYTINASGSGSSNFTTFANAVSSLTCGGITGPVLFNVADGSYTEQISITSIPGASNTNRVIFTSNSNDSTKVTLKYGSSLSTANYTLSLNGVSYVTFKKMTIQATGTTYANVVDFRGTPSYDSIANCRIYGYSNTSNTTNYTNIYASFTVTPITQLTIYNNVIKDGSYGMYVNGNSSSNSDQINVVHNQFTNQYSYGAYLNNTGGVYFNYNTITSNSFMSNWYGVYTYWLMTVGRQNQFIGNRIYGSMTGYGMYIYYLGVNSSTASYIYNNMIQMGSTGSSTVSYGLYFTTNYQIFCYNNTCAVYGTSTSNYPMYIASTFVSTTSVFKNNLLANLGNGSNTSYGAAFYTNNTTNPTFDYNDYFVYSGNLANLNGTNYSTLSNWQSAVSTNDANAVTSNPSFTSSSDLHINNLCLRGVSVATVTNDYDGDLRNNPPNIGADESNNGYANDLGVSLISSPTVPFTAGAQTISVVVKNFGTNTVSSGTVKYSINGGSPTSVSLSGSIGTCATTTVSLGTYTFSAGTSYSLKAYTTSPNGTTDGNTANDTTTLTACTGMSGTYTINASGSGSRNYTSFSAAVSALNCGGITGSTVFKVADGTYNEQISLTAIQGASSTNRVRFISNSNDSTKVTLTYASSLSTANYTASLNSASYVTFKKITIAATGTTYANAVDFRGVPAYDSIANCIISGVTTTSSTTNMSNVFANFSATPITQMTLYNNVISNGSYGVYWYGTSSTNTDQINIVNNQFTNQYAYGAYAYYTGGLFFNYNTITSNSTNGSWNGIYAYYIATNGRGNQFNANRVYGSMNGIGMYLYYIGISGSNTSSVANNMIQMGSTSSSTTTYGLDMYYAYYCNIYNNTAVVYGTSTSNYALYGYSFSTTDVMKNNIWANLGNGSTSYGAAAYFSATTNVTFDYNDLFVWSGGNIGNLNGTAYNTLSGWKTAVSTNDANSVSSNPGFTSSSLLTISDGCLRGTNVSLGTDFYGTTRSTTPSLGCYEVGSSVANDLGVSAITSPTSPVSGTSNIVVTVKNFGTNTVSSATVYYSVNGGTAQSLTLSSSIASCSSASLTFSGASAYNFTGGSVYAVKAYTSNPNGVTDGKTSNDTTVANLCGTMSGTYTINPSGSGATNFTSFTAAVSQLYCAGISGPVVFKVSSGTYNEQITLSAITGASSSNTVTFQSASGDSSTVSLAYAASNSSSNNYTVFLNGCQWVNFKKITISRTGSGYTYSNVIQIDAASSSLPASNNSFRHCQIIGPSTTSGSTNQVNIYSSGANARDSANYFVNNLIQNNSYGVNWLGYSSSTPYSAANVFDSNTVSNWYYYGINASYQDRMAITNNTIKDNTYFANYGIYGNYLNGVSIKGNTIKNIGTQNSYGPYAAVYLVNTTTSGLNNQAITFQNNKINIVGTYAGSYAAVYFNTVTGTSSHPTLITNNFVYVGGSIGWTNHGFYDNSNSYAYYYYNSVWNASSSSSGACFYFNSSGSSDKFRDNCAYNSGSGYGIYVNGTSSFDAYSSTTSLNSMGYNNYYVAGSYFGYWSGSYALTSIGSGTWATATGSRDNNCISYNPNYNSSSDLTVTNLSLAAGTPLSAITTDIKGVSRSASAPTIGATEIPSYNYDASISAINFTNYCAGATNVVVTLTNYGRTTLSTATVNWKVNGTSQTAYSWTGSLAYGSTATLTLGTYSFTSGTYTVSATSSSPDGQTDQNTSNDQSSGSVYPGLSGTYTIGSTGTYASFTAAVSDLTIKGLCGAVKFNVQDGTYTEQIAIGSVLNASSTNRIIFTSNSNDSTKVTLTYNALGSNNYTVYLNNTSYITFKKMTIQASNSSNSTVLAIAGTPTSDSIASCRLYGVTGTSTAVGNAVVYGNFSTTPLSNNYFYNNIISGGSFGIYWYGNSSNSNNDALYILNNQFTNQYAYGAYLYYAGAVAFNYNTITSNSFTSNWYGVYTYWLTTPTKGCQFNNNRIYGAMTGTGIYFFYIGVNNSNPSYVTNNMVQMGATSSSTATYGFYVPASYQCHFYNNSCLVYGTNTSNAAMYSANFYNGTSNIYNNIFANYGNGTTSYGSAWNIISNSSMSINYNDYSVNSGGNLINYNGTNYTVLSNWKTVQNPNETNSIATNPGFTSTSDLHASNGMLKAGIGGYVSTDFDGQTRASIPCIGADEFTPSSVDAGITSINKYNYCPSSQVVNVTIANGGSSTLSSATINWQVNGVTQTAYSWTGSLATGATASVNIGSYTFASGSYSIKAWTTAPNGTTDAFHANDTSYTSGLGQGLSGTYTIGGSSPSYTTFNNAVTALNTSGVCGAVTFNVRNGMYNERISIGSVINASSTNTVTFQSQNGDSSLVYLAYASGSNGTLELNAASYINFKKITIQTTGTSSPGYAIYVHGGSNNNNFYHNRIYGLRNNSTGSNYATIYSASDNDTGNTFRGNLIRQGAFGFYWFGVTNTNQEGGNTIDSNYIDSSYYMGIQAYYETRFAITNNIIQHVQYPSAASAYGIYLYYDYYTKVNGNTINTFVSAPNSGIYTNYCHYSLQESKNKIYFSNGANYGIYNYYNNNGAGGPSTPAICSNNFISLGGSTTAYGIYDYYCYYLSYYYNNINITNTNTASTDFYSQMCCSVYGNNFENNCLVNTGGGYNIYLVNGLSYWNTVNYNNYYASGTYFGYNSGTTYTPSNLSGWQSATSKDANTVQLNPSFTSASDLHIANTSLHNAGTSISGITTDIDGQTRPTLKTTIGADEIFPNANDAGVSAITPSIPFSAGTQNVTATITNYGSSNLTSATISWTFNGVAQTPYSWTGSLSSGTSSTITLGSKTFTLGTSYTEKAWTVSPNGGTDADHTNDTTNQTVCPGLSGIYTINPSGSGSSNFTSFTNAIAAMSCGGIAGPVLFKVADGTYNEQLVLGSISGMSNTNRVIFTSNSNDSTKVTLTYNSTVSTSNYTVSFAGGSYFTFKKMTLAASNSTYGVVADFRGTPTYDSIANCKVLGVSTTSNTTNLANIYGNFSATGGTYLTFYNNVIQDGAYGIYWYSTSGSNSDQLNYLNNKFTNQYAYGFYSQYTGSIYLNNNTITSNTTNTSYTGVYIYWAMTTARNNQLIGNRIYGSMVGTGMSLGYLGVNSSLPSYVENNMVQMGNTTSTSTTYGIYWTTNYQVFAYNNTAAVYGTSTSNYSGYIASAFVSTTSSFKNNIYANLGDGTSSYGAAFYTSSLTNPLFDYNDYYVLSGNIASYGGSGSSTLSAWQTAVSTNDANARSSNPVFASSTLLNIGDNCLRGTSISGLTTDIYGTSRAATPSMGAYEVTSAAANDLGVVSITAPVTPLLAGTQNVKVLIKNYGSATISSGSINYTINGGTTHTVSLPRTLVSCDTATVTFSGANAYSFTTGSYTVKAWTSSPNGTTDGNTGNDTSYKYLCTAMSGVYTINPSGSGTSNYTSFTAAVNALGCGGISGPVVFKVSNGLYNENISISGVTGVSSTNTITFQALNGNPNNVLLSKSTTGAIVSLSTSYIRFKNITINNTYSTTATVYALLLSGSSYDSFVNCRIVAGSNVFGNALSTNGTTDAYNVFYKDSIYGEWTGISISSATAGAAGVKIIGNTVVGGYCPLIVSNYGGIIIDSNTFSKILIWSGGTYLANIGSLTNSPQITRNTFVDANTAYQNAGGITISTMSGISSNYGLIANNFFICNSSISSVSCNGLYLNGTWSYMNIYHNSVLQANANAANTSAALYNNITSGTSVNIKNNIFKNTNSGFAVYVYNSSATAMNYNDYYTAGSSFGYLSSSSSTYSSLAGFKTGTGYETNGQSVNVGWASTTDLHLTNGCSSPKGVALSSVVPVDIDNQTRSTTAPFMGADEYYNLPYDIAGYVMTAPTSPPSSGPQVVTVKFVNKGNNVITSLRANYTLNGGTAVSQTLSSITFNPCDTITISFTATSGPGSTDQRATLASGTNSFKAYCDNINSGVNTDGDHTNDTIYKSICGQYTGILTINTSAAISSTNFHSFNAALIALQNCGIGGAITIKVYDGTYNEQVNVTGITGLSATNTLTFISNSNDSSKVVLTYASSGSATNNYTLQLSGVNYVTFKQITITRTGNNTYAQVVNIYNSSNNHFYNNYIRGSVVASPSTVTNLPSSNQAVIYDAGSTKDTANTFVNNRISNGDVSFYLNGINTSNHATGTVIQNNYIDSAIYSGALLQYQRNLVFTGNTVKIYQNGCIYAYGARLQSCDSGLTVTKNKIIVDCATQNARGIYLISCVELSGNPGNVANNFVTLKGGTSVSASGIATTGGSSYHNIYNNSVVITNTYGSGAAFDVIGSGTYHVLKNNVFYNSGGGYAVGVPSGMTGTISAMNYNDFYVSGSSFANWNGISQANFATWKTSTSFDANSINFQPSFVSISTGDLHVSSSNPCVLKNRGTVLATVLDDIDGDLRGSKYDIGADQYISVGSLDGLWVGGVSTSWLASTNWCTNLVPTSTTNVTINSGVTYYPVIDVTSTTGVADSIYVASGGTLTVSGGTISINGQLSVDGTYNHSSGTLKTYYIPSVSTIPLITGSGTFNYTGGAIEFAASGAQIIPNQAYWGVTTSGSGTKSLNGTTTLNGNLVLGSGTTLSIGAHTLNLNNGISSTGGTLVGGLTSKLLMGGSTSSTTIPAITNGLSILGINRASGILLGANIKVNDTLYLSNGVLDLTTNSDSLFLPNAANIVRSNGTMNAAPTITGTGSTINLYYLASLTTGYELPSTVNNVNITASGTVNLNANLTINGNFNLTSGNFVIGAHQLSLGNGYSNSGTLTGSSSSDLTIFDFSGSAAKITMPGGLSLHNFTINRSNGAGINGNVFVSNNLTMTKGNLYTDNTGTGGNIDTLMLGSSGSIVNENDSSFVSGRISTNRTHTNDGVTYTYGNIGTEIKIPTTGNNPSSIKVTRSIGVNASGSATNICRHNANNFNSIKRVYHIEPVNNGGLQAALTLHYLSGELNGIPESGLDVYRKPENGPVFFFMGTGTRSTINKTLAMRGPADSFSTWTCGGFPAPLPVELISFNAQLQDATTSKLNWVTASEINNDHFDIERSEDNIHFTKVGEKAGNGTTQNISKYEYLDHFGVNVLSPILYYRLKQVDYNGAFIYSNVVKVVLTAKQDGVKVWYNRDVEKLQAIITVNKNQQANIKVVDVSGKVLANQSTQLSIGNNAVQLDMNGLAKGEYTFIYTSETGEQHVSKFIKY